jgi:hypothetical protein
MATKNTKSHEKEEKTNFFFLFVAFRVFRGQCLCFVTRRQPPVRRFVPVIPVGQEMRSRPVKIGGSRRD